VVDACFVVAAAVDVDVALSKFCLFSHYRNAPRRFSGAFAYTPEASVFFVMSFRLHVSTRRPLGRFS
jgi:hypothetical protein